MYHKLAVLHMVLISDSLHSRHGLESNLYLPLLLLETIDHQLGESILLSLIHYYLLKDFELGVDVLLAVLILVLALL